MGACTSTNVVDGFGADEHAQVSRITHQIAEKEMKEVSHASRMLPSLAPLRPALR